MAKRQRRRTVSLNPRQYLLLQKVAGDDPLSATMGRLIEQAARSRGIEVTHHEVKAFGDALVGKSEERRGTIEERRRQAFGGCWS